MNTAIIVITILVGLSAGFLLRYFLAKFQLGSKEKKLKTLINEAEEKRKKLFLEPKRTP